VTLRFVGEELNFACGMVRSDPEKNESVLVEMEIFVRTKYEQKVGIIYHPSSCCPSIFERKQ
jgi:hypothetical protein